MDDIEPAKAFYQKLNSLASYWERQKAPEAAKLIGLAFSIVSILDGSEGDTDYQVKADGRKLNLDHNDFLRMWTGKGLE